MSQQLTPTSGGVQTLVTTPNVNRLNVLSEQYIKVKGLENRPTEWVHDGRPIYKRLPSASQTYQINFEEDNSKGYVYIPWGEGSYGPTSLEAVSSDTKDDLIIKSGNLVWAYGTNPVPPTLINLANLGVGSGRYFVAYRLIFDSSPVSSVFTFEDYSLNGSELIVSSSTDGVPGWRYPVVNSFLDSTEKVWSNYDSYFPEYTQPTESFIQWQSNSIFEGAYLPSAYLSLTLRCPPNTAFSGTATLSFVDFPDSAVLLKTDISRDSVGQFFYFDLPEYIENSGNRAWRVDFSDSKMSLQSVRATGSLIKAAPKSGPFTRSALVIHPENAIPATYVNSQGAQTPLAYCPLAIVDVGADYKLENIEDVREIVRRDYTPVSNWLTAQFDESLINLYEQVNGYSELWMNPHKCMKQEYASLTQHNIILT